MIDFFIKLFKAFNSSQTPWQMSLAISLGMVMGLTPLIGWQSIIIVLFVLIINVHIGLFIVSSGFFAGLAYLLDPSFESLGYSILTNPNLQDYFTTAYNSSIMRMTYFNNTLVIGSSIVAFALLAPMYFILDAVVYIYRLKIASVLQKYTIFKTLGIEVSDKKDKIIRIWGFGLFAVLGGLVVGLSLVFLDPLAKMALQKGLSKLTNKEVQIQSVNVQLKEGSLELKNLNIFENGISSVQADTIAVNIDFNQLLFKRYHIESLVLDGLKFKQETDAQKLIEVKEHTQTQKEKSKNFKFDTASLPEPETLIGRMGLSSTKNYNKALSDISAIEKKYKGAMEGDLSKGELKQIKADAQLIKSNLKKIKNIKTLKPQHYELITQSLDDIKALRKKLKQKRKMLKNLKNEFKKDKENLVGLSDKILSGAKGDYNNLSKNYQFNAQGGVNVVGVLFGNDVKEYMNSFLNYYEMAKPYLNSEEELPAPQRGKGQWIKYNERNPLVDFYAKNIDINGVYHSEAFVANIKNISSNQKLLNKVAKVKINSQGKLSKEVDLGLVKLNNAKYTLNANANTWDYITLLADVKMHYTQTKFSSKKLDELKEFNVDVKLTEQISAPKINAQSDLDKKLKVIFEKAIKEKLAKYKQKLKTMIDTQMNDELAKLGLKEEEVKALESLLNGSLDDFSNTEQYLDKYEDELKSQAKSRAKEKVKEKVGDLLKSFKF